MVIVHINNSEYENATQRGRQRTSSSDDFRSNPFDNIKLTCQNLFSNLTERLVAGKFNIYIRNVWYIL